jgi:Flp pilus assembly secretin CpaC
LRIAEQCRQTLTRAPCSLEVDAMTRSISPARLVAALAAAAVVLSPAIGTAQSGSLNVGIDQAQRVQLRGPAGSVIVGNPAIADVTVVDSNTLYITGKGYGVTEIVAVDTIGRTVFQSQVIVTDGAGSGRVRVWRGGQATEMACAASCSPTLRSSDTAPTP